MNKQLLTFVTLAMLCGLSGCSYLNIGESEYSCPGKKHGVTCAGTRTLYDYTNGGQVPIGVPKEVAKISENTLEYNSEKPNENVTQTQSNQSLKVEINSSDKVIERENLTTQLVHNTEFEWKDVPVRTPARVMRIWFAPWTDQEGDLNMPGYIYTEIESRRWIFSDPAILNQNVFNSIK